VKGISSGRSLLGFGSTAHLYPTTTLTGKVCATSPHVAFFSQAWIAGEDFDADLTLKNIDFGTYVK
jgi:hypothetical protein